MMRIKTLVIVLALADLLLIIASLIRGNHWLISSQTAFFASLMVTYASFLGYKRMIEKKIEAGDIPKEARDELDAIEDPHELYEEADLKTVIEEERAKIASLKTTAIHLGKSLGGALSAWRVIGYVALALSFLYLNRHGLLHIGAYLTGLSIVPLSVLLSLVLSKE